MKNYHDEFAKEPVAKMAQSISDMTFCYKDTRVPATHYKKLLNKQYEELVEGSVAINLLNTYYKTLKTLFDRRIIKSEDVCGWWMGYLSDYFNRQMDKLR